MAEKEQIIRKSGLLEYYKVEERFENVGGLGNLKRWLRKRANAFTTKARDFGLPEPKGVLLIGVPGCGKSLTAKAVSALWGMPLLRLDMGSVFGKYIGESEFNIRKAIKVTESISPAILWIDEIEKGLSGAAGDNTGTSNRVFGTLLTWMQEKKKPVFVIATANDVSLLPPELLRKVRFDEIFFIDLPETRERQEIFEIHLRIRNRNPEKFDLPSLAEMSQGFSGSEIEQVVISSLYDAFEEGRDIVTEDVKRNIENAVPLSQTMKEKIEALREWAWGRTRNAS